MAGDDVIELAEGVTTMRNLLNDLWSKTRNPARKKKIRRQLEDLDVEIMRLISINIKASGEQYEAAIAAVAQANSGIKKAIRDLNTLVAALEVVAVAVELVSKVRPA